jgi:3-mercaptopyruvate sulfurtransferase SseA
LYKTGTIEGQFKDAAELADIFGKAGLSETSSIVIYDDGSQKYNAASPIPEPRLVPVTTPVTTPLR